MRFVVTKTYEALFSLTVTVWLDTSLDGVTVVIDVFEFRSQEGLLPHKRFWAVENVPKDICWRVL